MYEGRTRHQLFCSEIYSALTKDIVKSTQYLDASCNSINVAKKITLVLMGTNWLVSRAYIDNIGVIQELTGISMAKVHRDNRR